ncbi:cell filamentation protein Fic [Corallococcus sp. AB049A]|uniref:Fic family protein n=1 Tax=Corallococcus sp. AB049A TaxID=2316721 RepID=UPI000EF04D11|nr:Fic family protein [Corallococcus sp. AB049A]RKI45883.1 cell filamentation protein Fic [Corallococcus sp. AB049A]
MEPFGQAIRARLGVDLPPKAEPIGYARLVLAHELVVLPHHQVSFVAPGSGKREHIERGRSIVRYPPTYAPQPGLFHQLEFALKYEGVSLEILSALFEKVPRKTLEPQLLDYIQRRPTGQYSRRLWFLYEFLTGHRLELPDVASGNYVPLLDPQVYFTATDERSRRHRVINNLLGTVDCCPMVRRTGKLKHFASLELAKQASRLMEEYDADALRRAVNYLYTKETRSSFAIEREKPSPDRTERYVALLRRVPQWDTLDEATLTDIQNQTVDPRFAETGYRQGQNYIGETVSFTEQKVHYLPPRPEDVPSLMKGLLASLERMAKAHVDPIVQAAAVSFVFVLIHPFLDGNGRLHRLLIHYILSRSGFTPQGIIFPVSAVMLQKRSEYDACLESFSAPLMQQVDYTHDEDWQVTVKGKTGNLYRAIDCTRMAEDLYAWTEETIRTEFRKELEFIVRYRQAREQMEQVVDMPDRQLNLFIQGVLQNKGRLSATKRASHFELLTDAEVQALEEIIQEQFLKGST